MTTEQEKINKANAASQTLFRFASLRNPQLAEAKNNDNFIVRDPRSRGYFDEKLVEWYTLPQPRISKMDFLIQKIKAGSEESLCTNPRSVKNLRLLLGMFYDAGKLLAKEGNFDSIFGKLKARTIISNSKEQLLLDPSSLNTRTLWDTVIYEVLMQDNFYLKEVAIQTLQAINYFIKYDEINQETTDKRKVERFKSVSLSKVVLPQYIFVDAATEEDDLAPLTVNETEIGDSYIYEYNHPNTVNITDGQQNAQPSATQIASLQKKQNVAFAELKKEELETLKKELEKLHRNYQKSFIKSYDISYKEYLQSIQPEQDAYAQAVLTVEAGFTEETTEAQKRLAINSVAKPSFSEFVFEAELERNLTLFKEKLSAKSLSTFAANLGTFMDSEDIASKVSSEELDANNVLELEEFSVVFPEDENLTYEEILQSVNEKIKEANDEIYDNTEVEKQKYVSIGGVLVPLNSSLSSNKTEYLNYTGKTITRNNKWSIMLTFNDSSVSIISADYHAVGKTRNINDTSLLQYTSGVYQLFDGNNMIIATDVNDYGFIVNGTIKLSDGKEYLMDFTLIRQTSIPLHAASGQYLGSGRLSLKPIEDNPENPNNPTSTNDSFIPSGFGIKRLGIADYLKVEQSTHAYIEGEVANIENIMAREYREKSTRRLRRSEVTETISTDTERERLTDTTTANRFEMQSEVAKILQESTDIGINANTSFGALGAQFNLSASYANHRSKEESMRQAVTQAQDVTARALDRVVTKVHEERIEKIIEEFEENNTHGFDNRKGDKNVVGVYRWVDKLMKNQVWNYGKRMMFEFMIPQPAKLHTLAMESLKNGKVIDKPIDPRTSKNFTMADYTAISNENVLKYWSSVYNVELEAKPDNYISIGKSLSGQTGAHISEIEFFSMKDEIQIPEGYKGVSGNVRSNGATDGDLASISVSFGDLNYFFPGRWGQQDAGETKFFSSPFSQLIPISATAYNEFTGTVNFNLNLELTTEAQKQWQQKNFKIIIEAYETALAIYNQEIAEEEAKAGNIKETNANFYRQIEQDILKHNCIAYVVDPKVMGTKLYDKENIESFEILREKKLDEYTALAKFMEQAFEWELMSYNFYPYFWGAKADWQKLYQSESMDPLFRSFLQSGMGRVVVTVRPGFEDAVQFYMSTGRLWNGGEVPVIGDPMYLSIVDELKNIKGEAQGKSWMTRVPTPLTILQAKSIGLEVKHALPFTTEDPSTFENPDDVITESNFNFKENDSMMEAEKSKLVSKLVLDEDSLQLTTDDNQVLSEVSIDDLKIALE